MAAPRAKVVAMVRDVADAAKAVARPAPMDVVKVAVKDVETDAIAVADAADVVANAAVNAAANAIVLMPKENRWPLATTPRAWLWMPTEQRARAPRADAAVAIANVATVVNAASVPSALKMVNARRIALATRLRKPTPTAMTMDRVKPAKAVKADAAVAAVAVAMTAARVWTKPATRFLRHQAKTKPMDRHLLKAAHAKARTTRAAMVAAHATVMAASVAPVVAVMPVQRTRNSKPQATSRCASPSAQVKTAMRPCVRTSRKPRLHQRARRKQHRTAMSQWSPWRCKPTRLPMVRRKPTRFPTVRCKPPRLHTLRRSPKLLPTM